MRIDLERAMPISVPKDMPYFCHMCGLVEMYICTMRMYNVQCKILPTKTLYAASHTESGSCPNTSPNTPPVLELQGQSARRRTYGYAR
jgi:hypothetical protein